MGHVSSVRDHVQPQLLFPVKRRRAGDAGELLPRKRQAHIDLNFLGVNPEAVCLFTNLNPGAVSELMHQEIFLPEVSLPTFEAAEGPFSCVPSVICG